MPMLDHFTFGAPPPMPLQHAVPFFRATMPGIAGVVLASRDGGTLAHDLGGSGTPALLAARALQMQRETPGGESVLVPHGDGQVLVVFMDQAA